MPGDIATSALNPQQLKAATYGIGKDRKASRPLLILAGAGTGKTKTIVSRICHLVANQVDPDRILVLAFGNRAASEIANRMNAEAGRLVDRALRFSWVGTFHSVGARLIRQYARYVGIRPNFTVLSRSDSIELLRACRFELAFSKATALPSNAVCQAIYSYWVNTQKDIDSVLKNFPDVQTRSTGLRNLLKLYADGGYQGPIFRRALKKIMSRVNVEIIKRSDATRRYMRSTLYADATSSGVG